MTNRSFISYRQKPGRSSVRLAGLFLLVLSVVANRLAASDKILVKVHDASERPVVDVRVIFFDEHRREFFSDVTDAKGLCRFISSAPKNWQVPGRVLLFKKDFALAGGAVKRGSNSFQVGSPSTLRGICKVAGGHKTIGTKVRLIQFMPEENAAPLSGMLLLLRSPLEAEFTSVTDDQGKWSIGGVPGKGRALVEFEHPDYHVEKVIIRPGVEYPLLMRPRKTTSGSTSK